MKNEYIIYNLVLELRNGDYNVIEINNISNINLDYPNSIETIDAFTMHFSENELKDLIEKNNMVSLEYLKGNFKIISNLKHRLPILTKEDLKTINEINNGEIELETNLKDKLYGYYKKTLEKLADNEAFYERLKKFKEALKINNYNEIFELIKEMPYSKSRSIYVMLCSEITRIKKEDKPRKLEKLDDVA